ncbi:hypothetical protein C8F04DRAFT_1396888 [Mycena alexandri]|uniref:HMG box domain-containing protein n=1 Tax=Mycena alexandri TaxID=1745969 RepID=A0AAD6X227_9AGAR|nr:hypothetical protein C8F04DRAFT_1396888 [Mycena alexandri]
MSPERKSTRNAKAWYIENSYPTSAKPKEMEPKKTPNSFICYRSSVINAHRFKRIKSQTERSKLIGAEWKAMNKTQKQPWVDLAAALKKLAARRVALAASDAKPDAHQKPPTVGHYRARRQDGNWKKKSVSRYLVDVPRSQTSSPPPPDPQFSADTGSAPFNYLGSSDGQSSSEISVKGEHWSPSIGPDVGTSSGTSKMMEPLIEKDMFTEWCTFFDSED